MEATARDQMVGRRLLFAGQAIRHHWMSSNGGCRVDTFLHWWVNAAGPMQVASLALPEVV